MNNSKMITIFNQRLAGYLMMHSFVLVGMQPSKNKTGKNVFFFNDTEDLQNAISEYKKKISDIA